MDSLRDAYLDTVIDQLRKAREELAQANAGARMADDNFCQLCGARGYARYCHDCANGLGV